MPKKLPRAPRLLTQGGFERGKSKELKRLANAFKENERVILRSYDEQRSAILKDAKQQSLTNLKLDRALNQLKNRKSKALHTLNRRYDATVRRINNLTYAKYVADHKRVKKNFADLRKEIKKGKLKVPL